MIGAMVAGRFETALLCLGVAVLVAVLLRAPRPPRSAAIAVAVSVAVALALNLYLVRGRPLPGPAIFGLRPSAEGLRLGALLSLRVVGATAALYGLRAAWPGERAADELAGLLRPLERLRVPVSETRVMIALALRFTPLLAQEARRIARVQELRAGRPPRGLAERLVRHRAATVPTLVSALERAEQTALALEARHYRVRPVPAPARARLGWGALGLALAGTSLAWRG